MPGVPTKPERAGNPEALSGLLGGYGSGSDNDEDAGGTSYVPPWSSRSHGNHSNGSGV